MTTKINLNKEILALFSGQASVVTTPKLYIMLTGNHALAIILNQCVYWSNKSENKDGWFYKEYKEWFDEIHMPERTLRRRFDRLEQMGWITTKVKKIRGTNTKHIFPHMDKIIASISTMLDTTCPDRPLCPVPESSINDEQKPCTKITPTGQNGRSEPAKVADSSIDTEDYLQKKLTNCESSSSFYFSETIDQDIVGQKLFRDDRTDDEFLKEVIEHVENHSDKKFSRIVRAQGAIKLLAKLKSQNIIFYVAGKEPKEDVKPKKQVESVFTDDELAAVNEYKHAKKMEEWGAAFEVHMPNQDRVKLALSVIERIKAMEATPCKPRLAPNSARKNSLTSASNLVSHLA